MGCSDFDEWLLDALSAERLLKQLRGPTKPAKLDLINACVSASTGPLASGRRDSWQTPPRGAGGRDSAGGGDEVPVVDFRSLLHGGGSGTPGDSQQAAAAAGDAGEADGGAPQLRLRSLQVGAWGAGGGAGIAAPAGTAATLLSAACVDSSLQLLAGRWATLHMRARLTGCRCCRAEGAPAEGAGLCSLPLLLRRLGLARPPGLAAVRGRHGCRKLAGRADSLPAESYCWAALPPLLRRPRRCSKSLPLPARGWRRPPAAAGHRWSCPRGGPVSWRASQRWRGALGCPPLPAWTPT